MKKIFFITQLLLLSFAISYSQTKKADKKHVTIDTEASSLNKSGKDSTYVVNLNIASEFLEAYPYLLVKMKLKDKKDPEKELITVKYQAKEKDETGKDKYTVLELEAGEPIPDIILISDSQDSLYVHKQYIEFRNVTKEYTDPPTEEQKAQWAREQEARKEHLDKKYKDRKNNN